LLERAEKNQELKTESETIYEEVKDQIVATGRQSEATARYSAAVIPAFVTVKAEQTGKSPKEIYEMMGLSIVGPAAEVTGDVMEQAKSAGYEGDDTVEATEWQRAVDKGLDMSTEGRMARAKEAGFDTETVWYHGTGVDFEAFDPSSSADFGIHLGTVDQARDFATTQTIPTYVTTENTLEIDFDPTIVDPDLFIEGDVYWKNLERITSNFGIYSGTDAYINNDKAAIKAFDASEKLDELIAEENKNEDPDYRGINFSSEMKEYWKAVGELIQDKGFDSVEYENELEGLTDIEGKPTTDNISLIVFDPSKTRSVNAAFDPDFKESAVLLAQSGEDKNLVVTHNLSAENILATADLGGLAAPSIATIRTDISDFESFGEVSLLADPSLLESAKARTFDADIYSPRQPRPTYDIDVKKFRALKEQMSDAGQLNLSKPDINSLEDGTGADNLQRSTAMQYLWLKLQGKEPKLKNKKIGPTVKRAAKLDKIDARDKKFQKVAKQHYQKMLDAVEAADPNRAERYSSFWFLENGEVIPGKLYDFESEVRRFKQQGATDTGKLRSDIDKKMRVKKTRDEYDQWVTDQFNDMVKGKRLFKGFSPIGNRKYIDYNMQNVVKEMTQQLQAGEASFYGSGTVRSAYANEMKTIKQVQARRDQIVSEGEMTEVKQESSDVLEDTLDKLKPFYKFDADSWGYAEDAGTAIVEGRKGLNEAFNMTPEAQEIVDDLTEYLTALSSSYFETKIQRPVGFGEFNTAVVPKGMNKSALKVLKDAGLKIKTYDPSGKGITRQQVISKQEKLLFQEADKKTRATIQLLPDESIIKLHQASDLSSFLHESAHLFLEMEGKLAAATEVTPDQQIMLDWLEVESFDAITKEEHEKFAETFEVYLREGKAPSLGLRDAFAAFKRWLIRIYQSLTDPRLQRAELTPEITEVFDRMLATEAEIELATANPAYDQFFKSKEQSGMSDAEWEEYQARQLKAKNRATETLDTKLMKELTKRRTAEWNEEKAPLIEEETERLREEQVYIASDHLVELPMDRAAVKEIMGYDKIPKELRGKTISGGVDPQLHSEMHGYANVEAMINEIAAAPKLKTAANDAAEARMVEKYGDILNDGSIENEAREAVHNDAQAQLLLDEIKALKPERANKINRAYLKAEAKTLIGSMNFKEIKPNKYYRAEIKAAQKAVTATDKESQYIAKVQQLANHYMYRGAVDTKERMVKQRKYVKSTQTRDYNTKQVNPEYVHNMKTLANLYDMRTNTDRALELGQIVDWYNTQINDPNQYVAIELLDINLIKALQAKQDGALPNMVVPTFNDLTAQDLQGLHDMLRHLRYVGGVMSDLGKAEQAALVESIKDSIIKNGGKKVKGTRGIPQKGLETKIKFSTLVNKIPSLRNLIRRLDDNFKEQKEEGLADKEIYRAIEAANSEKIRLGRELYEIFETELGDIHRIGLVRTDDKTYALDSGLTLDVNTEARFMIAVYWGTESSRDAIRDGYGLTDNDVSRILADLTNDQIRTVNSVWKVNETQWTELSKASVNMYGVAPTKLDATPFAINGIEMTGGHMRLMYSSTKTEKLEEARRTDLTSVVPTKAGSLHARVGGGGKPVKLYTTNISQALEENTHFISFAEAGRKIQSVINHPDIVAAIETYHGEGFYKAFVGNIESTVANRQQRESDQALAGIAKLLRKAAVYKHLAFSIRNVVQQVSAIAPVVEEVGVVPFVGAAQRFISKERQDLINFVDDRSEFMRDRASLVNKEASDFLRSIEIQGSVHHAWDKIGRKGFMFQTMVDATLAYPTWLAKYETRFELHGDDKRAASEADSAVAESVGSGSDLHLGAWFSKNQTEWMRIFTLFGSWFNAYYQRIYESTSGLQKFDMDSFKALFATPIITAVLSAVIIMDYPDDDSDEAFTEWLVKRYVYFMAGTIPFIREIAGSFSGFAPKTIVGGGQEVPSRFINELISLAEGKQTTLKGTSDIIKLVTTVVPVPGVGNVTRVMDFIDSNTQGKETGSPLKKIYQSVVEGPDKNK